jgi:hypothetical protein
LGGGVFINYRGDDSNSYGALLYRDLRRRFGRDSVFLDSESIPAGTDFVAELAGQVRRSRVLLAVIGPRWLTATGPDGRRRIDDPDDWIRRELVEAFDAGVTVIPVLTDNGTLPSEDELPADIAMLARLQYRLLRHRDATADLTRIRRDIRTTAPELRPALHHGTRSPARTRTREWPDLRTVAVLLAAFGLFVTALAIHSFGQAASPSPTSITTGITTGSANDPDGPPGWHPGWPPPPPPPPGGPCDLPGGKQPPGNQPPGERHPPPQPAAQASTAASAG